MKFSVILIGNFHENKNVLKSCFYDLRCGFVVREMTHSPSHIECPIVEEEGLGALKHDKSTNGASNLLAWVLLCIKDQCLR